MILYPSKQKDKNITKNKTQILIDRFISYSTLQSIVL